nr:hypothetical protein [uncultured Cardiobacterium sp.]
MTFFATNAVELSFPPGRPSAENAGSQMLAKSGRGCFRELGHCIFHDFLAAGPPSCRFRRAAQAAKTPLTPSRRAADSAGSQMLAKSGRGCFRELGHRIFHDFLAAGLPSCRFRRAAQAAKTPLTPSRRAADSAGSQMLAKSERGCFRKLGHRIFHDFLCRRAADYARPLKRVLTLSESSLKHI